MEQQQHTYLLCYLRTGGGHLAPARAIAHYIAKTHPNIHPALIDGLENVAGFARYIIEDGYRILQAKAKWFYEFLYATNKFSPIGAFNVFMANLFIKPVIKRKIIEHRPEKIIIFHFFLIKPIFAVLRELKLSIPVVTVITDPFTAHPLWFKQRGQNFILFSERLQEACLRKKEDPKKLHLFPFIINEKFSQPMLPEHILEQKKRFGFDGVKKIVLIIGGGDGIPHGEKILNNLLSANLHSELAIVAGKNKKLYHEACALQKKFPYLKVFGFVDFVYELINTADIVITKCGASTIMEILMMKKIPIIIDYLWEQELGNMQFVRDNKLGIFEPKINRLPSLVKNLTENSVEYETFQHNIEQMHLRNGTPDVGEFIVNISQQRYV